MSYWFEGKKGEAATSIFETVDAIQDEQAGMRERYVASSSLYLDRDITGFKPGEFSHVGYDAFLNDEMTFNVVRSVVDTLVSKLTVEKPSFKYLTSNGTEILQSNARKFEKILIGEVEQNRLHAKSRRALKNMAICGNASMRIWMHESGKVCVRPVHPAHVTIDSNAAIDGEPMSRFEDCYVSRHSLIAAFPDKKDIIKSATTEEITGTSNSSQFRSLVKVREAWRKTEGKLQGRYVIAIDSGTLLDEDYDDDFFPYADMVYIDGFLGWHGIGLVENIAGIQRELNGVLDKVKGQHEIFGNAFLYKPRDANINDVDINNNARYKIIEGTQPPTIILPAPFSQQDIQYIQMLRQAAFDFAGIGEFSATSSNPAFPRLESAKALRFEQDRVTERFSETANSYNEMMKRAGQLIMLYKGRQKGKWQETGQARKLLESVDWSLLDGDGSKYHLTVSTISALPRHPSGRIAEVTEMAKSGLITREQALQLFDLPDLEKFNRLTNASIEDLETTFEYMLTEGEYVPPLPFQDLSTGLKLGTSYWLRSRMDGVDEEKLDLVARWLQEASDMLSPPPEEPPPGAAPAMPVQPQDALAGLPADPMAAQMLGQAAATLPQAA